MKAVLWPYKYASMGVTWAAPMQWVAEALQAEGFEVLRQGVFRCLGLERLRKRDPVRDPAVDIAVYNHAFESELSGKVVPAGANWFFKPCGPTPEHTALDPRGYGPHSTAAFVRPALERLDARRVQAFWEQEVLRWRSERVTKWGGNFKAANDIPAKLPRPGYVLVLGQCDGDSVVTRMDFGSHVQKLKQVVAELRRLGERVVVKLHPYMDGMKPKDTKFSDGVARALRVAGAEWVSADWWSVHALLPGARVVVTGNSGAGVEALMWERPVIAWGAPEWRWAAFDLRLLSQLQEALRLRWWDGGERGRRWLYWWSEGYCFRDAAGALARVKGLLEMGGVPC